MSSTKATAGVQLTHRCIGRWRNEPVTEFTWTTRNRMTASIMTYGATVTRLSVPNRWSTSEDVVLGFDTLAEYVADGGAHHFGSVIGRCANVIADAEYELRNCSVVELTPHAGGYHIDGGVIGLGQVNWLADVSGTEVVMSHVSAAGDQGYPGTLLVQVRFAVTVDNCLRISYMAQTDRRTPVNLSHRVYMNLGGHAAGSQALRQHVCSLNASQHVEYDRYDREPLVPTGRLTKIGESACDFRLAARLEQRLRNSPLGYLRETFVINGHGRTTLPMRWKCPPAKRAKGKPTVAATTVEPTVQFVGRMIHPASGRVLEIYSSQRCVEFSTGHQLPFVEALSALPPLTPSSSTAPASANVSADRPTEMCADIIESIVDDFADTERFVLNDILSNAFAKMMDAQFESDGTVSNEVARQIVQQLCEEMHQLDELVPMPDANAAASLVAERDTEPPLLRPIRGKAGAQYVQNGSFYAQTQNFPDAVHHRGRFGDVLLTPDRRYRHELVYKFGLHMGNVPAKRLSARTTDSNALSASTRPSSSMELNYNTK